MLLLTLLCHHQVAVLQVVTQHLWFENGFKTDLSVGGILSCRLGDTLTVHTAFLTFDPQKDPGCSPTRSTYTRPLSLKKETFQDLYEFQIQG